MLKKWLKSLLGHPSTKHGYRKYSSSDHKDHRGYNRPHGHSSGHGHASGHGHSYYGSSHYKRKHSSRSFFSS